jgi:hypothetical protein
MGSFAKGSSCGGDNRMVENEAEAASGDKSRLRLVRSFRLQGEAKSGLMGQVYQPLLY